MPPASVRARLFCTYLKNPNVYNWVTPSAAISPRIWAQHFASTTDLNMTSSMFPVGFFGVGISVAVVVVVLVVGVIAFSWFTRRRRPRQGLSDAAEHSECIADTLESGKQLPPKDILSGLGQGVSYERGSSQMKG